MTCPSARRIGGSNHHMSGGTSGYPALRRSRRFDCGWSNPGGNVKLGNSTQVMFASIETEWLMARCVRYSVSVEGNTMVLLLRPLSPGLDLRWCCKKANPVPNFHFLLFPILPIRPPPPHSQDNAA